MLGGGSPSSPTASSASQPTAASPSSKPISASGSTSGTRTRSRSSGPSQLTASSRRSRITANESSTQDTRCTPFAWAMGIPASQRVVVSIRCGARGRTLTFCTQYDSARLGVCAGQPMTQCQLFGTFSPNRHRKNGEVFTINRARSPPRSWSAAARPFTVSNFPVSSGRGPNPARRAVCAGPISGSPSMSAVRLDVPLCYACPIYPWRETSMKSSEDDAADVFWVDNGGVTTRAALDRSIRRRAE